MSSKYTVILEKDLEELAKKYLSRKNEEIHSLYGLLKKNEFQGIETIGHKIRGTAGSYGFELLGEIGKNIESHAIQNNQLAIYQDILMMEDYIKNVKFIFNNN